MGTNQLVSSLWDQKCVQQRNQNQSYYEEIDANHEGQVAIISCALDCLPRTEGIVQGDFIGFGGSDTYRPNTITYVFDQVMKRTSS